MPTYGSDIGAKAYVGHIKFGAANNPTDNDLTTWLEQRSAQLTGWLSAAGYAAPVAVSTAKVVLDRYANIGAAGDAELALRSSGYDADDENRRENKFLSEFAKAEAWIKSGALKAMGVSWTDPAAATATSRTSVGLIAAGRDYLVRR